MTRKSIPLRCFAEEKNLFGAVSDHHGRPKDAPTLLPNVIPDQLKGVVRGIGQRIDSFNNGIIYDILVLLFCFLSFALSWIESTVNTDSHHWGFMYVPAFDIHRGRIPYGETLIAYGYLTTWIQSASLSLFGNSLRSIGIVTGLFYAFSLFLSYQIFRLFVSRALSLLSVIFIVLLHPYIIHPWPNYFCYSFQLLSLLLFLKYKTPFVSRFLSGVCLGAAFLCRYSAVIAILPPCFILLGYEFLFTKTERIDRLKQIVVFSFGFLVLPGWFLGYLASRGLADDFFIQNKVIAEAWSRGITVWNFLPTLLKNVLTADTFLHRDLRSFFFTVLFFSALIITCHILLRSFTQKRALTDTEKSLVLVGLVALCGYFNSVHVYQIFRLINGASIAVGLLAYLIAKLLNSTYVTIRATVVIAIVLLCGVWTRSLLKESSSIYLPWDRTIFTRTLRHSDEIPMLHGKLVSDEYYGFYDEVRETLRRIDPSYSLINYTWDPLVTVLTDLHRIQIMPFYLDPPYYLPFEDYGYRNEKSEIAGAISNRRAVVLATKDLKIPGYKVIFAKPWSMDVPWFAQLPDMKLYISVPDNATAP
jgi:hypothetical protein